MLDSFILADGTKHEAGIGAFDPSNRTSVTKSTPRST
jgi:hypothetical protein